MELPASKREKKYLVIGSSGHSFVKEVSWDESVFPNLVDFDVIIANVNSLEEDFLKEVPSKNIENMRRLLSRFLCSSGTLIILCDFFKRGENKKRYPESYNNYSWCPIDVGIEREEGDSIEVSRDIYPKYFSKLNKWEYYFYVPNGCITQELKDLCGESYEVGYVCRTHPFLKNREGRMLAGSVIWTVTQNKKNILQLGEIHLLPTPHGIDSRNAINLLLEDILGKSQTTLPPAWIDEVEMPRVQEIDAEITKHCEGIKQHEVQLDELRKKKEGLEYYKKLLYADGEELENVFKECLIKLGGDVRPAMYSQEEYSLIYEGSEFPVEAKGNTKSISMTDLRQLMDYLLVYDEKNGQQNKGILLGNAWKNIPPKQRNVKEKPYFPSNVIKRSESLNIALVSAKDFFEIFSKYLDGKASGKSILDCIVNAVGVVDFSKCST